MMSNPHRSCKPLIILFLFACTGAPAGLAEIEEAGELGLFQMIARSELLVHVRVREGALKHARVEVVEAIKGEPPASELRVAFREYNWRRLPGEEPIVFSDGQEEILFLARNPRLKVKEKNRDLFDLYRGRRGRITPPAEGGGIILEALRVLVVLTRADPVTQVEGLLDLLRGTNLYLLEAALDEIIRLRAASPARYPDLVALLSQRSPGIRSRALQALEQVFSSGVVEETERGIGPELARSTLGAVIERARNDEDKTVRVRAVTAMAAWPVRADIESGLAAIAVNDPSQLVRYEAERILFRMETSPRRP
jgi:hypothetical protein